MIRQEQQCQTGCERYFYTLFQEFHFHDGKDRKKCHVALGEGTIDLKKFKDLTIKHDAWVNLEVKQASDLEISVPYFRNI